MLYIQNYRSLLQKSPIKEMIFCDTYRGHIRMLYIQNVPGVSHVMHLVIRYGVALFSRID